MGTATRLALIIAGICIIFALDDLLEGTGTLILIFKTMIAGVVVHQANNLLDQAVKFFESD